MLQRCTVRRFDTADCMSSQPSPSSSLSAETFAVIEELSVLLNTNLTRAQLEECISLIESGQVSPDALAIAVNKLRDISATVRSGQHKDGGSGTGSGGGDTQV